MITELSTQTRPVTESGIELLEEMLSIPSPSTQERQLGQWLVARLRAMGFAARRDEAGNVVAFWGSGPHEVLLLGHMDTVPGFIPVRREGNRLFGRGAVDAKGPLAAAITAVARQPGAGPNESAADRAIAFIRKVQDHAAAPTLPSPASGGGKNARTVNGRGKRALGAFDRLDARILRFHADHDGFRDTAAMTLGFRLPPNFDVPSLQQELEQWADGAELRFEYADPAVRAEKNTPVVRAFLKGIRDAGGTPRFKMKTGTSDMNILAPVWGCPTLAYGPGDSKLDHTPDEAIDLDDFARGVDVLTSALNRLAR